MQWMYSPWFLGSKWIYVIFICNGIYTFNSDVLWESCDTTICGRRQLNIQCDVSSYILINNVTSGLGQAFDRRSYLNLRRMCLGMQMCDPSRSGFCRTHSNAEFKVSYVCVRAMDVDNECVAPGKLVSNRVGFITSPNYPALTQIKNRREACKWSISVPSGHYLHIVLHEVLPSSSVDLCKGLLFQAESSCGKPFPTFPICDESRVGTTISSCSDTTIIMSANRKHAIRFWLSYYVVPVSDLREVLLFDIDITCNANKKDRPVYRPRPLTTLYTDRITYDITTALSNNTREVATGSDTEDDDYVIYVAVIVAVVVVLTAIIVVAVLYIRRRQKQKTSNTLSPSISNSTDIQKRPLPEFQTAADNSGGPTLHEGYSCVADEITSSDARNGHTYSTYAEIEDYSDGSLKPNPTVTNRRSIGSSVRELPATPDEEPYNATYSEIDDKDRSVEDNSKKNDKWFRTKKPYYSVHDRYKFDNRYSGYNKGKKLSNASNIYADVYDSGEKRDADKVYVDMSHKESDKVNNKGVKDKFNQSKRSQGVTVSPTIETKDTKKMNFPRVSQTSKKESLTSAESDSDDELYIVENELYEPFESAKV